MRLGRFAALAFVALVVSAGPSRAAIISGTYSFSASGFSGSGVAPADPVMGSFTVTFDNSTSQQPVALSDVVINISGYTGNSSFYLHNTDEFVLEIFNLGSNDVFNLDINHTSSDPVFGSANFQLEANKSSSASSGSVSFTSAATTTPEPASLALCAAGLAGWASARRDWRALLGRKIRAARRHGAV